MKTRADIERCWVKFCVNLLKDSVADLEAGDLSDKVSKITEMKNTFEDEEDKEEEETKEEEGEEKKEEEEKIEDLEAGEKREVEGDEKDYDGDEVRFRAALGFI